MDSGETTLPLLHRQHSRRSSSKSLTSSDVVELRQFQISLKWCGLDHSSAAGKFVSCVAFVTLAVVVPAVTIVAVRDPEVDEPMSLNKLVQVPETGLAVVGFFSLWRLFRRYGLRQLLFIDEVEEDCVYVQRGYARELDKSFRYLAFILFPSFFLQFAHKIIFFSTLNISFPGGFPVNSIAFMFVLGSWVYRTGVFLVVCILFRLTCELQILRLEGVNKLLETSMGSGSSDAVLIFNEHLRIRKQLKVTSHRYRFFIIVCLLVITVSQFLALLLVLASKTHNNFFNSADIVVCSAVQLCGFFLCLFGAARITHRAQGIAAVATRWHMLVTSAAARSDSTNKSPPPPIKVHDNLDGGDTDSDSSSDVLISVTTDQEPSSFQTRQALVSYLQHNNGGITLFGFALDRGLLHTLFAFEFSLVMWILSKVVVLS